MNTASERPVPETGRLAMRTVPTDMFSYSCRADTNWPAPETGRREDQNQPMY
jgi:hypothetical protein